MNYEPHAKINSFVDLTVWKEGHKLVLMIYKYSKLFPREELYSLSDQIKRAVVSVTSNVVEGFGRKTYKEKLRFYYIAQGSLIEVKNQLIISRDVGYLSNDNFNKLSKQSNVVHQLLQGLITSTRRKIHKS